MSFTRRQCCRNGQATTGAREWFSSPRGSRRRQSASRLSCSQNKPRRPRIRISASLSRYTHPSPLNVFRKPISRQLVSNAAPASLAPSEVHGDRVIHSSPRLSTRQISEIYLQL